jgi:hypothetical protein
MSWLSREQVELESPTNAAALVIHDTRFRLDGSRWGCQVDLPKTCTIPIADHSCSSPVKIVAGGEENIKQGDGGKSARQGARMAAVAVSISLLLLCIVCITLKEGRQPFWQGIFEQSAGSSKDQVPLSKAQTVSRIVQTLANKIDKLDNNKKGLQSATLKSTSKSYVLPPESRAEKKIRMVPLQPETINAVPTSLLKPLHTGKQDSYFLNW